MAKTTKREWPDLPLRCERGSVAVEKGKGNQAALCRWKERSMWIERSTTYRNVRY
jgi:hypothetical protein